MFINKLAGENKRIMKHNSKAIKSHSKLYDINKRGILIWDNFVSHSIFNLIRHGDGIKACVVLNVAVGYT